LRLSVEPNVKEDGFLPTVLLARKKKGEVEGKKRNREAIFGRHADS